MQPGNLAKAREDAANRLKPRLHQVDEKDHIVDVERDSDVVGATAQPNT
jgi:hypothetical protein